MTTRNLKWPKFFVMIPETLSIASIAFFNFFKWCGWSKISGQEEKMAGNWKNFNKATGITSFEKVAILYKSLLYLTTITYAKSIIQGKLRWAKDITFLKIKRTISKIAMEIYFFLYYVSYHNNSKYKIIKYLKCI